MPRSLQLLIVGPLEVNCYLYWDPESRDGVIIDPGAEDAAITDAIKRSGFTPKAIILTHGHSDHIGAVNALRSLYSIPVMVGRREETMVINPTRNLSVFVDKPITLAAPERVLEDEELLLVGTISLTILATPGHTPGGICLLDASDGVLFCGDTLFQGSIGRTDFPGGSTEMLLDSIRRKILALPDQVVCYPGHGPRTTVGAERRNNPFLTGAYLA